MWYKCQRNWQIFFNTIIIVNWKKKFTEKNISKIKRGENIEMITNYDDVYRIQEIFLLKATQSKAQKRVKNHPQRTIYIKWTVENLQNFIWAYRLINLNLKKKEIKLIIIWQCSTNSLEAISCISSRFSNNFKPMMNVRERERERFMSDNGHSLKMSSIYGFNLCGG